ncbi:nucleotidyltransferase family protein [Burkholderia glumae]|uniref:Nucleotidyltransferase family protein n=1 Tax=Burkholderia glumae TaxID=337 RepID=A0AAP9Y054_BURGL|nr:mobA-like NTP transferase domain protein [Burkholderia glumae LMG 2196 = ATCC 33617]PJO21542.1 nucleotidyltransferase family protein [Burkholderia glumae AU6208]PNL05846.1 nucleotidyltransferase family protein [Burkholderia glumae]QGA41096.1 NTP transferase domain-containing protein [Burkholderia glumae]QHE12719.1 NTP transferase domain-containing protein [Burkholderia glumae AU6208]
MPDPVRSPALVGVLLAAGLGTRFDPRGRDSKLLAALPDGTPVAVAAARRLLAVTPEVHAVVRPGAGRLADYLAGAGCRVLPAEASKQGMGASLAAAVRATREAGGWLVALGDMPWIGTAAIRAVAQAITTGRAGIAAPRHGGRRGHPVGFAAVHGEALAALGGDAGARALLGSHPVEHIEVDDPGVLRDVDTREDLLAHAVPRHGLAALFDPPPERWGLRGDPHLWDALRARLAGVPLPDSDEAFEACIASAYADLTGQPLSLRQPAQVPAFAHGGRSSGMVSPPFWSEVALPLLRGRLAAARRRP